MPVFDEKVLEVAARSCVPFGDTVLESDCAVAPAAVVRASPPTAAAIAPWLRPPWRFEMEMWAAYPLQAHMYA